MIPSKMNNFTQIYSNETTFYIAEKRIQKKI